MSPRSIIVNVLGLALIAFCFYFVAGHMRYLSKSARPSREAIRRELDEVVAAFPGEKSSEVEIFDKKSVYISARVHMKGASDAPTATGGEKWMEAHGWQRTLAVYGGIGRYCKGDLVAEVAPLEPNGAYTLQVNWGNADAVCQFK